MGILDKIASALAPAPRTFNVLLVGLDNGGKTTLVKSLKSDGKPQTVGETQPTVGVQVCRCVAFPHLVPCLTIRFFLLCSSGGESQVKKLYPQHPRHVRPRKVPRHVGQMLLRLQCNYLRG